MTAFAQALAAPGVDDSRAHTLSLAAPGNKAASSLDAALRVVGSRVVARRDLEPWSALGVVRFAVAVDDVAGWQFALAERWLAFRGPAWRPPPSGDPLLRGFAACPPVAARGAALRAAAAAWAGSTGDARALEALAYCRRRAVAAGGRYGLEAEPLVGACGPAVGGDGLLEVADDGSVRAGRGGAARGATLRRVFRAAPNDDLLLAFGVAVAGNPRDVLALPAAACARALGAPCREAAAFHASPPGPGQETSDSSSLQHECSARARSRKSIHASRALPEMIARPKISRNE